MKVGDRVVLTKHAIRSGLRGRARSAHGRVVRVYRDRATNAPRIAVKKPGIKTISSYWPGWWRCDTVRGKEKP